MDYKYIELANQIKEKIISGLYQAGARLPSIRMLAEQLGLNSDTVLRAYGYLENEHLIYSVPKSGYYVVKSEVSTDGDTNVIDMRSTSPSDQINPYKDFYHCMEKAISVYQQRLFAYSPAKGMPELIAVLKKHLMKDQIFTTEQDIFITGGAQQALFMLCAMNFPNEARTILVEQPTYSMFIEAAKANNCPLVGIERTEKGIDLIELERIFKTNDIKFFYLMTRFQNPTGFSYTNKLKKDILRVAQKYKVYIVEDDYLADLESNTKADPIFAFDHTGFVIYVRSFSKTLLPGLRLGAVILPKDLQEQFLRLKSCMDLNSPVLSQGALEIYLQSNMYEVHESRIKAFYRQKMDVLSDVCKRELAQLSNVYVPKTGIFAYLEIGKRSSEVLVNRLRDVGLMVSATNDCYIDMAYRREGIRLCVCKLKDDEIIKAVKILKEELTADERGTM